MSPVSRPSVRGMNGTEGPETDARAEAQTPAAFGWVNRET